MSIQPTLGTVQETLLLPLIGRSVISQKHPSFFTDKKAVEICDSLDFNKERALRNMQESGLLAMAVRAVKMDKAITDFIKRHPKATILNVGAGLDTAFWRVDNGTIRWIDLDLPDSIALREQFLPPSERNPHIAKSVFDASWIADIGSISDGLLIQVPGVFPYIEPRMVKDFFENFPQRLPDAEIIFDTVSEWGRVFITQGIKRSGMKNATLKWGINDAKTIEKWNVKIKVLRQEPYFENVQRKWSYQLFTNMAMNVNDVTKMSQIFHLKFVR
jgi:O-methyltransferase involved in polyketide biosynthesis